MFEFCMGPKTLFDSRKLSLWLPPPLRLRGSARALSSGACTDRKRHLEVIWSASRAIGRAILLEWSFLDIWAWLCLKGGGGQRRERNRGFRAVFTVFFYIKPGTFCYCHRNQFTGTTVSHSLKKAIVRPYSLPPTKSSPSIPRTAPSTYPYQ